MWTNEQQLAIGARADSLIVSASAGSGKTAVLVERVLQRVCDPERPCDIDRFLIVTFTKAAAAEIREKINAKLRDLLAGDDVKIEAYQPLGHGNSDLLSHPAIVKLAEKYGKNAGQVILRFEVQDGLIVLPKSTNPERIAGNLDIFDFELTEAEMEELRTLDTGRGSHDPEAPGVAEMLLQNYKIHD